jgi:imidazolonepropionase-like amidohydrolase
MQRENSLELLEVGKWADLVVLTKNPMETVENWSTVEAVVKHGRYHSVTELRHELMVYR